MQKGSPNWAECYLAYSSRLGDTKRPRNGAPCLVFYVRIFPDYLPWRERLELRGAVMLDFGTDHRTIDLGVILE